MQMSSPIVYIKRTILNHNLRSLQREIALVEDVVGIRGKFRSLWQLSGCFHSKGLLLLACSYFADYQCFSSLLSYIQYFHVFSEIVILLLEGDITMKDLPSSSILSATS